MRGGVVRTVPDEGRKDAKIVLVGEAPGANEMAQGRPFVGASGQRLAGWWQRVGLSRRDIYITNVVPYQPKAIDKVPREEMEGHIRALHGRIAALDGPNVIVPVGNYALYGCTGKGRVSWHQRDGKLLRPGITSLRGSIMEGPHGIKTIPSIHPAATFVRGGQNRKRSAQFVRACLADWERIADDCAFPELRLPQREHYIKPTLKDIKSFMADAPAAGALSLDIETPRTRRTEKIGVYKSGPKKGKPKWKTTYERARIGCIAFSYDPRWSLTIPLTEEYWKNPADLEEARACVAVLLSDPAPKVMQNGLYDTYWLAQEGMPVANWLWDTRAMHHCIDPAAQHALHYLASIYTRQPYWKDEAKDPEELAKYTTNDEALWTYNGIDAAVTLEIFYRLHAILVDTGYLYYYLLTYGTMSEPLLETSLHGMRMDDERREREHKRALAELETSRGELKRLTGTDLVAAKGISTARLMKYLYKDLGIPPVMTKDVKTGLRRPTTNEVALKKIRNKRGDWPTEGGTVGQVCGLLLQYRKLMKNAETFAPGKTDADGRIRCLLSPYTDTCRLKSEENPCGTGTNLQNRPRDGRAIFLPDED
jgi:DNA polymerase